MTGRSLFAAGDAKESRARLTSDQEVGASKAYASSSCRASISPTQGSGVGTDPQDELSVGGIETDSSLLELEARVVGAPEAGRSNVQGRGRGRGGRGQEGTGRAKEPCARFTSETHKLELPTVDTSSIPKVPSCRTESRGASTKYSQIGSERGTEASQGSAAHAVNQMFQNGHVDAPRAPATQELEQKVEEVQQSVLMRQWDEMDDDELQREMARLMALNSQLEFAVQARRTVWKDGAVIVPGNMQHNDATSILPNGPPCADSSVGASVAPGDEQRPHGGS